MRRITRRGVGRRIATLVDVAARPLRAAYYERGVGAPIAQRLPTAVRRVIGTEDDAARGSRRIEIGSGPNPRTGYIHVDVARTARHLEHRSPAWRLPFPDEWASEVSAIHVLEHIPPRLVVPTLREWLRVLRPGGTVRVHVPDSNALFSAFSRADVDKKWALNGAILGMSCGPDVSSAAELRHDSQHQVIFDFPLLSAVLDEAGYETILDVSDVVSDHHTVGWRPLVPRYSLVVEARKPGPQLEP